MNKKTLIIAGATALLFLALTAIFFTRGKSAETPAPTPAAGDEGQAPPSETDATGFTNAEVSLPTLEREEKEAQRFLENFAAAYRSYVYGDFSGAEGLTSMMTEEMKAKELARIAAMRAGAVSAKTTVRAEAAGSEMTALDYAARSATFEVSLQKKTYAGVIIADPAPENRDKEKIIRTDGRTYAGSFEDLMTSVQTEKIRIAAVKTESGWRVSSIETIA